MPAAAAALQPSSQPCQVLVKLGGAALTHKDQLETLNGETLAAAAAQLGALHASIGARFVVVHGAGSFGHQQAAEGGVAAGGIHSSAAVRRGFTATRASVLKLNGIVVAALLAAGVPAVGVTPCPQWTTRNRAVVRHGCDGVEALLAAGLVPVLHGDSVIDEALGCTVLSGDVIVSSLCRHFSPPVVAFLTNVSGIYDRPPQEAGAQLIARLEVAAADGDGAAAGSGMPATSSSDDDSNGLPCGARAFTAQGDEVSSLLTSCAAHDTTGGVATKVREAAAVARLGAEVRISRAGSAAAAAAVSPDALPPGWAGTVVRLGGSAGA